MQTRKFRTVVLALFTALLFTALLAVTASAEITVTDGRVVGLDASASYQYASVTLANYKSPSYQPLASGSTAIDGLTPGIWYIKNTSANTLTAVWVPGAEDDRTTIGDVYYSDTYGKEVLRTSGGKNETFVAGVWTGTEAKNHSTFSTYYISATGAHVPASYATGFLSGSYTKFSVRNQIQKAVFKYAYTPEEIIPVEDLYTMAFNVGVRQGSFVPKYSASATDSNFKTKYVLYTMDSTGAVTTHEHTIPSTYDTYANNPHSINIPVDFPNATGWVIGLDIYPYGVIPLSGLDFDVVLDGTAGVNTCFSVEYKPKGYTTRYTSGVMYLPSQYNGANIAFIEGYGDGTFAPDGAITRAEAVTILAKIFAQSSDIPTGRASGFADCTVNDWYNDAVAYLESLGALDYITTARFYPNQPITRGEFAQIIYALAKVDPREYNGFKDIDSASPYYEAICTLADMGFINGYGDRTFRPDATITRAEAVTLINRIINLVATEATVDENAVENTFTDINSHWAKYQILMAANNNVKSASHVAATDAGIFETETTLQFETAHIRISLDKHTGKVVSIINKYDNTEIMTVNTTPWFTYLTAETGVDFYPKSLIIEDRRLKVTYANNVVAYFIIDTKDEYMTIELDSELPQGVAYIYFANLYVNTPFSDDPDSYRLSGVSMNINTEMTYRPGGATGRVIMYAMGKFGAIGAKAAITFSKFEDEVTGVHRQYLKMIADATDPALGIYSTHGGPYTYDNTDVFGDYVIQSGSLTAANASATADTLNKYSVDQLDIHQGGSTFIQGNFNFVGAKVSGETFTTAAQFKERIGDQLTSKGIQLGLHTYSSLISGSATDILTDPKWQQYLAYEEERLFTLSSSVTSGATSFTLNESTDGLVIKGQTSSGGASSLPWSGPYTGYFLIDEEIIRVDSLSANGFASVVRGQMGTKAVAHDANSEIRHLLGHYGMFQPEPGSPLFFHIADNIAKAYNDGGFEMIYLDGLESFARNGITESEDRWYYYAQFIKRVVDGCEVKPIIEGSAFPQSFWFARARGGATDCGRRAIKMYNLHHAQHNMNFVNAYLTATLGWFEYSTDRTAKYKNTTVKTVFRDDIEFMGALGIAFDMSMSMNTFTNDLFNTENTLSHNALYSTLFSRLRKAGYFSSAVKDTLKAGLNEGKEYKMVEYESGKWGFREARYIKNRVFDMNDDLYVSGSATNAWSAQTPYIRIEQRYSTRGGSETTLYAFDPTTDIEAKEYMFDSVKNVSSLGAYKISVCGNGDPNGAILLKLNSLTTSEAGTLDFFIPTSHTGWREFILIDADNADFDGYSFNYAATAQTNYATYRNNLHTDNVNRVRVDFAKGADYTGVKLDTLTACTIVNSPVKNPSVTIGSNTITFNATVRSGEYIEYLPELNKAYHHSYNTSGEGNGNTATVKEITFTGSVTVPNGDFTFTYNASSSLYYNKPAIRAQVVIGLLGDDVIKNEATHNVALPEDFDPSVQYATLK